MRDSVDDSESWRDEGVELAYYPEYSCYASQKCQIN
jgi:hypothetical protein